MKTIALRFSDNFAPECGTIASHQELIDRLGFVWYGKMGIPISASISKEILTNKPLKVLLIHSGYTNRYWATVSGIQRELPALEGIPSYYRDNHENFNCWFKLSAIEAAPRDIMSKCYVTSSGRPLSIASRRSMSPYFIITYDENGEKL